MFTTVMGWNELGSGRYTYMDSWVDIDRADPDTSNPTYVVQTLFTPAASRGKNQGSMIMERLCELADKEHVQLALKAASFDMTALNDNRLVEFYCKFGFIMVDSTNNWMERVPNG